MDFLKEHLGDELYAQVESKLKSNDKVKLANLAGGEYVGKDKFLALETEKKGLLAQIQERDAQLEQLKKVDAGALQSKIAELQKANDAWATKVQSMALNHAIDAAILKSKGRNPKAIKALLDTDKIKMDGDAVTGIDEQIDAIKKSDAYLFEVSQALGGMNPPNSLSQDETERLKQQYDDALKRSDFITAMAIAEKLKQTKKK